MSDAEGDRHATAREMTEQSLRAQAAGDSDEADRLLAEAERVDADAVVAVLQEHAEDRPRIGAARPPRDREVAAMSRTVEPGASAPSRAGISGRGSGGDTQ